MEKIEAGKSLDFATNFLRKRLDVRVCQFKWPRFESFGLYHFTAESDIGKGTGLHKNGSVALSKALGELLERECIHQFPSADSSNGVAGYFSEKGGKQNAFFELIERDQFLVHFLTRTPFKDVSKELLKSRFGREMIKAFDVVGYQLKLGLLYDQECLVTIAVAFNSDRSRGVFLDTAADNTFEISLQRSVSSVALAINADSRWSKKRPDDQTSTYTGKPFDHRQIGFSRDYADKFDRLFDENSSSHLRPCDLSDIVYETIEFDAYRFFVSRASSAHLMDMKMTLENSEIIRIARVSEFCGRTLGVDEFEKDPHPFY